jgi:ABC-type cobalamin/Fe3+-siderophores transport system ATPase subunit
VSTIIPSLSALPAPFAELLSTPAGARYLKADLQVHTPVDPQFPEPSPEDSAERMNLAVRYLKAARTKGIELVGITEHNDVSWIEELREAARQLEMHLLPGFEVESKEGIHVLCLFDANTPVAHLEETMARLGITAAKRSGNRLELRSDAHFQHLIPFVQDQCGGICVAAHIESSKGLLAAIREGARVEAWKCPDLLAAQISKPPGQITSGNGRIVRGEDPIYRRPQLPAYLLTSDARSFERIGAVATWIKMDQVGVEGLRQAFLDPESRVAYEDPSALRRGGRIMAISWDGDFLDGIRFPVNEELNCLIGGKGTGKSTVIETIRYAFDLDYRTKEVRAAGEQLLDYAFRSASKISILIETPPPAPKRYVVERTKPHAPVIRDSNGTPRPELDPRKLLNPCVYGQKEVFGVARDARARLELIDGFAEEELRDVRVRESELLQLAAQNSRAIVDAQRRIDEAEEGLAELPNLEEWRQRFKEAGFEELLAVRRQLDREERLLIAASAALTTRRRSLDEMLAQDEDLRAVLLDPAIDELPNRDLLRRAAERLRLTAEHWDELVRSTRRELDAARTDIEALRAAWGERRAARTVEFERALRELQVKIPDVDPERYLDVERRIEQLIPLQSVVRDRRTELGSLRAERERLLIELNEARAEKHRARARAASRLNQALAGTVLVELQHQGEREPFLERLLKLKTGARSDQLRRTIKHAAFSPVDFVRRVRERSLTAGYGLPSGQATALERALDERTLLDLETVELLDSVTVSLDIGMDGVRDYRSLDRLSPGQKSTAILLLVMHESRDPLLVDQPEDDLDNRFIYDDIVKRLRAAKPQRQFLIATHNANIPILGDAEQIVVLDAREQGGQVRSEIRARGSIDAPPVRDAAEHILEGGREAFDLRQRKYHRS